RRAADLHPLRARVDEEKGLLALRDRGDDVNAGLTLARDEPLLAVQHPHVAVPNSSRREPGQVAACAVLRERPSPAVLAGGNGPNVAVDLLGRRDLVQLARPTIDDREAEPVRRLSRLLFERDLTEHRELAAAELGGHVQHREALVARLP